MNGKTKENVFVKVYEFDKPLTQKIDSIIDDCIRDCHNKYYHTFDQTCEYDLKLTNIIYNEIINISISDKSMGLFELKKQLTVARQNGFIFNQINKLKVKIYSNLSHINIHYYLKLRIPIMRRQFFFFQKFFSKS